MQHDRGNMKSAADSRRFNDVVVLELLPSADGTKYMSQLSRYWKPRHAAVGSAALYCMVAVAMNFVNKHTVLLFPHVNTIVLLQMITTIVFIHPLLRLQVISFPPFCWRKAQQLFLVTSLYTANITLALFGLRTLNIPMYSTLKRLTPIIVLVCKAIGTWKAPPRQTTASVSLVVVGCIVAGSGDLTFDLMGYVFALLSCLLQALYLLLVEHQGSEGTSVAELMYYNAVISLPFMLALVLVTGEFHTSSQVFLKAFISPDGLHTILPVLFCSTMGCLLNYSMFLCTMYNTALTTTMVGVLRGVMVVTLGFFFLNHAPFSMVNIIGIALNTTGGIWYSFIKLSAKHKRGNSIASFPQLFGFPPTGKLPSNSEKAGS